MLKRNLADEIVAPTGFPSTAEPGCISYGLSKRHRNHKESAPKKFPVRSHSFLGNIEQIAPQRRLHSVPIAVVCPMCPAPGHRRALPPAGAPRGEKPRTQLPHSSHQRGSRPEKGAVFIDRNIDHTTALAVEE